MGRWHTRYVVTSPLKVFKSCYIIGGIFGIFAVVSGGSTVYSDKTLNRKKWKGVLLGALVQSAVLTLVYIFCNMIDARPLGIILFTAHIAHLILFGIYYGKNTNKEQSNNEKQEIASQKNEHLEDVTNLVYETSCNDYMDMLKNFAIDLGKEDNYNKYYDRLRNEIQNLQDSYGYAIKGQAKHITAIACYYLLDADRHVFLHTRKPTVLKYFWDIVELLENNLDDPLLEEDSELFIKDIVDGYFYWGKGNPHNNNNCTIRY